MPLNAIKARLGSLSPKKLDQIWAASPAAWKLLTEDLPTLILAFEDLVAEATSKPEASQSDERIYSVRH